MDESIILAIIIWLVKGIAGVWNEKVKEMEKTKQGMIGK